MRFFANELNSKYSACLWQTRIKYGFIVEQEGRFMARSEHLCLTKCRETEATALPVWFIAENHDEDDFDWE